MCHLGRILQIYRSTFTNMWYAVTERKSKTAYKVICQGPNEKVVGLHIIGLASDEILQGFGSLFVSVLTLSHCTETTCQLLPQ